MRRRPHKTEAGVASISSSPPPPPPPPVDDDTPDVPKSSPGPFNFDTGKLRATEESGSMWSSCFLCSISSAPHWMRDNEYILSGYRAHWSMKGIVFSVFRIHNETVNIWSHFFGFLFFTWIAVELATTVGYSPMPALPIDLKLSSRVMDKVDVHILKEAVSYSFKQIDKNTKRARQELNANILKPAGKVMDTGAKAAGKVMDSGAKAAARVVGDMKLGEVASKVLTDGQKLAGSVLDAVEEVEGQVEKVARRVVDDGKKLAGQGIRQVRDTVGGVEGRVEQVARRVVDGGNRIAGQVVHFGEDVMHGGSQLAGHVLQDSRWMMEYAGYMGKDVLEARHRLAGQALDDCKHVMEYMDQLGKGAMQEGGRLAGAVRDNVNLHGGRFLDLATMRDVMGFDEGRIQRMMEQYLDVLAPGEAADRWPMFVFLGGAMACLLCSSVCHTMHSYSQSTSLMVWKFDYAGIIALITASFYPMLAYTFMCLPRWKNLYLAMVCGLACVCLAFVLMKRFQVKKYLALRAVMFSSLGLFGVVPIGHQMFFVWQGSYPPVLMRAFALEVLMGVSYLSGAAIFAVRWPEKWWPGKFDLIFQSHNIFHFLVLLGCYLHYKAMLLLMQWRDHQSCAVDDHLIWTIYHDT